MLLYLISKNVPELLYNFQLQQTSSLITHVEFEFEHAFVLHIQKDSFVAVVYNDSV